VVIRPADLEASLARLSRLDDADPAPGAVVTRVVDATKELFGVHGAGMLLIAPDEALHHVADTDEPGRALERAQEETGQGPCVDAYVLAGPVITPDVLVDPRYPRLASLLGDAGVRAVLGVPVRVGGGPVGTLNVYRADRYDWDGTELSALEAYGGVIGDLLATSLARHRSDELAGQLRHALDYRVPIERAIGYLMASRGLSSVEAFGQLRAAARNARRKVVDLADDVLAGKPLP
jgi:GAF domain-containing protein